ncbi:DUF397 domain-containing protein [Streptomyces blattellae]|uniref:DUF397 domain-containing protein n=1 Tax=Streptomyces blattellae TaxID=2569855 RepID=UPI0012B78746|nr:DUF397 domain-containing protein [Streptomyces blattellae]
MNETPAAARFVAADWFKSSHSAANNERVEVAHALTRVGIRDSKAPDKGILVISLGSFAALVEDIARR